MDNQNPANNNPQNLANNNPPFEEFMKDLHSLTDEELQSIYGGDSTLNAAAFGVGVDLDCCES